jgi:hypothetical protein
MAFSPQQTRLYETLHLLLGLFVVTWLRQPYICFKLLQAQAVLRRVKGYNMTIKCSSLKRGIIH